MTKAKMLETLINEYISNMTVCDFFKKQGNLESADCWWRDAYQTEHIIHMLFGDDIDVYTVYLNQSH